MTTAADLLSVGREAMNTALRIIASRGPGNVTVKSDRDIASDVDYAVENELRDWLSRETAVSKSAMRLGQIHWPYGQTVGWPSVQSRCASK